ncbi:uncharacterized protein LOC108032869 [Drosophila biarmipes]|uniref:uncharacterized protein LOC108032869 n=1 Tax=Drosophila biarmipes TaxID=125945 RepID=UPI0007E75721|nr:uncharacterized protein LOC108032869 [Drosophila biarmipes]
MDAHSTAVAIIDMELDFDEDEHGHRSAASEEVGQGEDVRALVRRLQASHVWIRQQVAHLQRRLVTLQLDRQRRFYEGRERLQRLLRNLQGRYGRDWGL